MGMRSALMAATLALAPGCGSMPLEPDDGSCPAQTSAPVLKCFPKSLDPVADPASPDFGRVACRVFVANRADSGACGCDIPGERPLGSIDTETARQRFVDFGYCSNACCESLCFCELLQLSGDALARCQAGIDDTSLDIAGFCYVEPDVGVGDPSTVKNCRPDERQNLRFTPSYSHYDATLMCETSP